MTRQISRSVTVVIPSLGRGQWLPEALSRFARDDAVRELIVVDDRRAPRAPDALYDGLTCRVVHTGGLGPNAARQAGTEAAVGEVVLLVDDDVVPGEGLASGHAARHDAPGRVVVGYMPIAPDDPPGSAALPRRLYRGDYEKRAIGYERDPPSILRHLWGGNISLRRDDALRVGIANLAFKGYRHEDREFGIRCLKAGMVGVFDRRLRARHEYARVIAAFRQDARLQGAGAVLLHHLYPDVLGPWSPGSIQRGLPSSFATLIKLCATPDSKVPMSLWLSCAGILATSAQLGHGGETLLRLARRIDQAIGAREASLMISAP
jgi:Glycosyl transferase family 2